MRSGRQHLAKRGKQREKPRDWEQGNNRQHMPSPAQASCLPGSSSQTKEGLIREQGPCGQIRLVPSMVTPSRTQTPCASVPTPIKQE